MVVLVATIATATVAMAASLSLTSKNLTIYRTCVITANPNTTTAELDTMVQQDADTNSFPTDPTMEVQSSSGANHRSFVKFDLTKCSPVIPSSATVKVATLRLVVSTLPNACRTHDVFKATATWAETITWSTQPAVSASRSAFTNVGSAPCTNSTNLVYVPWDVTADVQSFVTTPANNFGWMLRDDVESSGTTRTGAYATKDSSILGGAPQLVVNYS
jgi:hypothetical protein